MTRWVRGLLGLLLGSALTLAIHPASREYLFGVLNLSSPTIIAGMANIHPDVLPPPTNTVDAAYWLQMASEKSVNGGTLAPKELKSLVAIAREGWKLEKQNAFWPQMIAAFLEKENLPKEAQQHWQRASHCQTWNDLQTKRLLSDRNRLADNGNWNQAWTYGYVFYARSDAPARFVQEYAKKLIAKSTIDDRDGLSLRYLTICNGSLLRDGSRSIRVGHYGADIVELATYPPSLSDAKEFKQLWIAQTQIVAGLRQFGLVDEAGFAEECFKQNEAWRVKLQGSSSEENVKNLCLESVALATFPGSLMLCAVLGLLTLIVVKFATSAAHIPERFTPAIILPLALTIAAASFWVTHIWPIALSVGGSLCFLIVGPKLPRKFQLQSFGPLFTMSVFCVGLLTTAALTLYFISTSTAATALLPRLGSEGDILTDSSLFLAVSMAMASLLFVIAPMWALVRRQSTPAVFVIGAQKLGLFLSIGCLGLGAISGPLTVYGDHRSSDELEQIVSNEPRYYQGQPF